MVGAFELQHDITGTVECQAFVGNGGAGDLTAPMFAFVALIDGEPHLSMPPSKPCSLRQCCGVDSASWLGMVCKVSLFAVVANT
jgi:hypothetical protein